MLKIKDNVDLKELEKYGLKAKYDEDTGEVKFFYIDRYVKKRCCTCHLKFNRKEKSKKVFTIIKRKKCNKDTNYISIPYYEIDGYTYVRNSCAWQYIEYDYDTLFDLIQAGLVEKVEEGSEE